MIEDDDDLRFSIRRSLAAAGHDIVEAESGGVGLELFGSCPVDLVLTDVNLGGEDGIDLVSEFRAAGFEGGAVVMTGYGSVDVAVRAMKNGADDFIEKPVKLDELKALVARLVERQAVRRRLELYERLDRQRAELERPLGESTAWRRTVELAERLASIPLVNREEDLGSSTGGSLPTILLVGETGVGKGVIARHIHESALEQGAPFVHINCSALPPQLVEGELFGHEKGAFTDAKQTRPGLFEMADGGTVFLDEIGDLPIELQAKLLTVLERGVVRRVGGTSERTVRARVITATNRDLDEAVERGTFRRDLLYRLNTFTVRIPALRERHGDAVLLARTLLGRFRHEFGRGSASLGPDAVQAIERHPWRGNVRELVNAMQRVAVLCEGGVISASDLMLAEGAGPHGALSNGQVAIQGELRFDFEAGPHTADEVEKELMLQALERTRGNVSRAARLIGMQRSSFRYRVERYGLEGKIQELVAH